MKKYVKIKNFVELFCQSPKNNILEFNQYMKSDKMPYIIYADNESLIKKQITVKIIQENLQQQKQENIFLADIQIQLFGHLIIQKISIVCIAERLYETIL